jgi:hypothetical protein
MIASISMWHGVAGAVLCMIVGVLMLSVAGGRHR